MNLGGEAISLTTSTVDNKILCGHVCGIVNRFRDYADERFGATNVKITEVTNMERPLEYKACGGASMVLMMQLGPEKCAVHTTWPKHDDELVDVDIHEKAVLFTSAVGRKVMPMKDTNYIVEWFTNGAIFSIPTDDPIPLMLENYGFFPWASSNDLIEFTCAVGVDPEPENPIAMMTLVSPMINNAEQLTHDLFRTQGDGNAFTALGVQLADALNELRAAFPLELDQRPRPERFRKEQLEVANRFAAVFRAASEVYSIVSSQEPSRKRVRDDLEMVSSEDEDEDDKEKDPEDEDTLADLAVKCLSP